MITIRQSRPEEIPQQKDLWKKCFGDPNTYIDIYYQRFCSAEQVLVVEEDGEINSMISVLPGTIRLPDDTDIPVGYMYALATNPYMQGKGHARQLMAYADQYLKKQGYKAMTLVPASPSLHRFFEALGLEECFNTRKVELLLPSLAGPVEGGSMTPISPMEYNRIREKYLAGTFHMAYTDQMIQFQQIGSHIAFGDLYKLEVDGEIGCTAIEYVQKRRLLAKELLISPEKMEKAAQVIASQLAASPYHIRTPGFWEGIHGSYHQEFGMIKWFDPELKSRWFNVRDGYLGLGFD